MAHTHGGQYNTNKAVAKLFSHLRACSFLSHSSSLYNRIPQSSSNDHRYTIRQPAAFFQSLIDVDPDKFIESSFSPLVSPTPDKQTKNHLSRNTRRARKKAHLGVVPAADRKRRETRFQADTGSSNYVTLCVNRVRSLWFLLFFCCRCSVEKRE